jgi:aryl-alcohol dehydrogenase-like predicted oxidoreductase
VEANLRSLSVERLDLVNLRLVGTNKFAGIALEEQLGALEDLRQEGKLDLIGLSNVDQMQVQRALELVDVAEIQNLYNIIDRRDDELITFAGEREIAFVPSFRSLAVRRNWQQTPRSSRSRTSTEPRRRKSLWRGCWLATTGCC